MAHSPLPAAYADRAPAYIKHRLLESYLAKLFMILGSSSGRKELCYVDCFAGPWQDESENLKDTSIGVSLRTLAQCREALLARGGDVRVRALFIEKNLKAFQKLNTFLSISTPAGVEAKCLRGDFVALRQQILEWTGNDAFVFFFIDPKGFSEIGVPTLQPLLARRKSEFLINFMYAFANRNIGKAEMQEGMEQLLGEKVDLSGKSPNEREALMLDTYRRNLKKEIIGGTSKFPPRSAHVPILHQSDNRTWYHLVYLTSHSKGIVEFMKISESVDLVQRKVRAARREAKREMDSGMTDLFAGEEPAIDDGGDRASANDVDTFWLNYLQFGAHVIDQSEFASILEKTDFFESDLQESLLRLIARGLVCNLDFSGRRPKRPLHFDAAGERLSLI